VGTVEVALAIAAVSLAGFGMALACALALARLATRGPVPAKLSFQVRLGRGKEVRVELTPNPRSPDTGGLPCPEQGELRSDNGAQRQGVMPAPPDGRDLSAKRRRGVKTVR
jgi:hypothetical protein